LKKAKIELLLGRDDYLSITLLRIHREQMDIFQGEETRGSYWKNMLDNARNEEERKSNEKRKVQTEREWKANAEKAFQTRILN
jgi:hypothetical protein